MLRSTSGFGQSDIDAERASKREGLGRTRGIWYVRMIPSVPGRGTNSDAERLLFNALSTLEAPAWTAFHSLNVSEHEYKRWGELDFVLLAPEGLFAIEVKGGGVSCHEGVWAYTDRRGIEHHSSEGPFRQAASGLMGLRARLEAAIPGDRLAALTFGYGVAFPQTTFDIHSVEWDDRTVLDGRQFARRDGIARWLRLLVACWRQHTRVRSDAPKELVAEIRQLLRPEFDRVPPLSVRIGDVVTHMDHLTEEQYTHLDFIEGTERNLIEGGAGTGKTFLAVEMVRREVIRGRPTLYTCESPTLAQFVRERVPVSAGVYAFAELPDRASSERVQSLLIDEGQDLMTLSALDALSRQVQGGLENGRWTMFLDPNQQSHLAGAFDSEALEILRTMASRGILKRNCRNTKEIVLQTRLLTGADLGNPMAGSGPPVTYEYFSSPAECASLLDRHLRALSAAGINPGEVAVLTTVDQPASSVGLLPNARLHQISGLQPGQDRDPRTTTFASVEEFKGLESPFVALIDVDRLETERDAALVYVGMTRARAGLWIAVNESLRAALEETIRRRGLDAVVGRELPA